VRPFLSESPIISLLMNESKYQKRLDFGKILLYLILCDLCAFIWAVMVHTMTAGIGVTAWAMTPQE